MKTQKARKKQAKMNLPKVKAKVKYSPLTSGIQGTAQKHHFMQQEPDLMRARGKTKKQMLHPLQIHDRLYS